MSDIFISYARSDRQVADALAQCLTALGWRVFIDRDAIPAGATFDDFIDQQLQITKQVVVLWSSASVASHWVKVEAHEGLRRQILVPVLIEEQITIPLAFRNLQARSLVDWNRAGDAPSFRQLVADLAVQLGPPPSTATKPDDLLVINDLEDMKGRAWVGLGAGTFQMGSSTHPDTPSHNVSVSSFTISRFPVTNTQYHAFVQDTRKVAPGHWQLGEIPEGRENHPVVRISWRDAAAFAGWLSTRVHPRFGGAVDLPTQAQWEFAARSEEGRLYPWGQDEPTYRHANFGGHVGDTTAVGTFPMGGTPAGVHDLAGNVWEWCRDWYGKYDNQESKDPSGPKKGSARVLRGGSFLSLAPVLRATSRVNYLPEYVRGNFGFRVVWSLAGGQK